MWPLFCRALDDAQLVLGRDAGEDRDAARRPPPARPASNFVDVAAGEHPVVGGDAQVAGNVGGRQRVVAGDHDRADAGGDAAGDRGAHLGARRVDHPVEAEKDQVAVPHCSVSRPSATGGRRRPARACRCRASSLLAASMRRRVGVRHRHAGWPSRQTWVARSSRPSDGALGHGQDSGVRRRRREPAAASHTGAMVRAGAPPAGGDGRLSCACVRSRRAVRRRAEAAARTAVGVASRALGRATSRAPSVGSPKV